MPEIVDVLDPIAEEAKKEFEAEKAAAEGKEPLKEEETSEAEKQAAEEETLKKAEESKKAEEEEASRKAEEEEPEPKSDEELLKASDEDLGEDDLKAKQELIKGQEDEFLDRDEKDLNDEEKTERAEIVQRREDDEKAGFDAEVKAYAEKKEIPEEDARKLMESADKLLGDTFKGDAKELARTHQHLQRAFDKTSQELRNLQHAPPRQSVTIDTVIKSIDAGQIKAEGKPADRDVVVEIHREDNPEITKDMDDETVLMLAAKEIKTRMELSNETAQVQFSANAKERRGQLLKSLKDVDSKLVADIEAVVDKMSDHQIMASKDLNDTVMWAKGKNYDKDLAEATKEAEARGFRRGQANRRIKTGPDSKRTPNSKTGTPTLSATQKEEAWDMFPQAKDDKDAFTLYADVMKDRKKT